MRKFIFYPKKNSQPEVSREYLEEKVKEFLDQGGQIKNLNYLGESRLYDLEDSDERLIESGDANIIRSGGRTEWDSA